MLLANRRIFEYAGRLLPLSWLLAGACTVVHETASLPVKTVNAVVPGTKANQSDPAALQTELLRFADDFSGQTATGLEDYIRRANTPQARSEALSWRLSLHSCALGIATGANPTANLVDFVALSSLMRTFLEQRSAEPDSHGAFDLWLDNSRVLESNAWKIAQEVLTTKQQEEFRTAITQWLAQNTNSSAGFLRRPQELAMGIRQSGEKERKPGSVFSFVGLDPTSGLDPAVREVTRSRLFAERALFAAQRMPFLVRWQTELLLDQVLRQEQVTNVITSAERLSRAAESATQTAASLPDRLTAERKAILGALRQQEGKLRDLSAEVGQTLAAGERMSTSLNTTLVTFDALMKRFGVGELSSAPPQTNSPPFNILDYARTAEQIGVMAGRLDMLIKDTTGTMDTPALDKRIADLNALSRRARADAQSVLNHGFALASGLIVLSFACALVYRRLLTRNAIIAQAEGSAARAHKE